jgi:hypothetical protein
MISKLRLVALPALVILLAACSSGAAEPDETAAEESAGASERAETTRGFARVGEGEVPIQTKLILGTLLLETTNLAVDPAQAAELVPLWKALRSLTTSDTAAAAELEALLEQIQEVMTPEQIEAITSFELTPDDMQSIMQELGIEFGHSEGFEGAEDGEFPFTPPEGFQGGPGGRGGSGGQGGFQGGGGDFDPEAFATQRAERGLEGVGGFGGRAGTFLFEPLIELLEERAGFEGA